MLKVRPVSKQAHCSLVCGCCGEDERHQLKYLHRPDARRRPPANRFHASEMHNDQIICRYHENILATVARCKIATRR